ncbi:hypothetical protein ECC02_005294 [Trypanosoma cruzi]|uniref:Nucleoporin n=1 Tax=Trypanosoma cruzi TaxID=5693 RepID=A0A7J6Y4G6_TRYCR|nr:hypothetical protein ECC02_005294 [Trypanosoma cruzi]
MSGIAFTSSTELCLGHGKQPGYARVLACRRYGPVRGKEDEVAAVFLDEKKNKLRVWRERKGITTLRGAGKYTTRIIDTATDGLFAALFFHHDKGRRLGLAIVQLSLSSATRLAGDPVDCSDKLDAVLAALVSREKKGKETTAQLQICCSGLKQTDSGLVVSLVVSTRTGELYIVIGSVWENKWRCFGLDAAFGMPASLCIQSDRVVSVLSCAVGPPIDHAIAVTSPTIELALSVFEATNVVSDDNEKKSYVSSRPAGLQYCVMLHEAIFSLDDGDPTIRVCYQSQLFPLPEGEGGVCVTPLCRIYADSELQRYAVVVSLASQSYLVHLRRSPFNMELVSGCTKLGLQSPPNSVVWLRLQHPLRPEGGLQIVLVLSQDYRLYAAEAFGKAINVEVGDGSNMVRFIPPAKSCFGDEQTVESFTDSTRLVRVGENELLCSNGLLAVVLRVTALDIDGDMPCEGFLSSTIDDAMPERRIVTLVKSLSHIEKNSNLSQTELFQLVFQRVLPLLRLAGSCQREVFLAQRVFQALLSAAAPKSASDWRNLWGLTMLLQRTLSRRDLDHSVVYTDMFFVQLADNYVRFQGTLAEQEQANEALLSVVSDELKCTWKKFVQEQDDDISFVLDSLAERVSLVILAEECVRRMVVISALTNGTHVVSVGNRLSHVIHTIATALLASCLEVPVYINEDNEGRMFCQMKQVGEKSLFLPPYPFKDRAEFEYAMTLSTDLLCVTSPDTHATVYPTALLSMLQSRRYHVVSAFLQIFTAPLTECLMPLGPICNNAQLLTECSAAVFLTEATLFENILSEPAPSDILCVLCGGSLRNDYFNTDLWRYIEGILSKDTQAVIVAAVIHAMTDRLIASQNNYSASVIKVLMKEGLKNPLQEDASVETCRKRLRIMLDRLEHLWACVAPWLPYKLEDIASNVLTSNAAVQNEKHKGKTISNDSVVFRTCVLCFRLLALIGYSQHTEEEITELTKQATGDASILARVASVLLQAIDNLNGTALPVESLQWRCVDLAAMSVPMCAATPGLAGFMQEVLQQSEASLTVITPLKQYYYTVLDRLMEVAEANGNGGAGAPFAELRVQMRERKKGASPTTKKSIQYFLWSKGGGADVPEWPGDHKLPNRRYLINTEWPDTMWPIEFVPQFLEECLARTQERIHGCDTTDCPKEGYSSPQFSHALFHQLCTLSPPVRNHALIAPSETTGAVAKRSVPTLSQEIHVGRDGRFPSSVDSASVPIAPSTARWKTSPELRPLATNSPHVSGNDDALTTSSSALSSSPARVARSPPRFSVSGGSLGAAAAAAAANALFPPERVAWWETEDTFDEAAKRQSAIQETLKDINIEITTTATSYTTATSEIEMHYPGEFEKSTRSMSFSPNRCKRHNVHHYRCAKHRLNGIHMKEKYRSGSRSCHGHTRLGRESSHVISSAAPKEKALMNFKLLQFKNVLRPPELPLSMATEERIKLVEPGIPKGKDDLTPPQLLSLRGKPHMPRVNLFAWIGAEKNEAEGEGNGAGGKNVLTARSPGFLAGQLLPLQTLTPPGLPPSSVFISPSSLLTLKVPANAHATSQESAPRAMEANRAQEEDLRVVDTDEALGPITSTILNVPVTPVPSTVQQKVPINVTAPLLTSISYETMPPSSSDEKHTGLMRSGGAASVPIRREEEVVRESLKPEVPLPPTISQPVATPAEGKVRSVTPLKEPVLSPSEKVAFQKYVDELKATGTGAVPVPVPPPKVRESPPASATPIKPLGVSREAPELRQEYDTLEVVKELLAKHEERQAKHFHDVIETIRTSIQRPTHPEVNSHSAVQPTQGLSAMEQAALVRHTIQQKDKLLMMNQDLLELHARAERLVASPVSKEAQTYASTRTIAGGENARPISQPTVPLAVPWQGANTTSATKGEVATMSSGVQVGVGLKKTDDATTMATAPSPSPIPPATEQAAAEAPTAPASQMIHDNRNVMTNIVPDPSSAMSINRSLSSLYQINAELLRVNATAADMERAIQESRELLHRHTSLGNAHMSAVEGSLMVDAMRRRTAALEQQLSTMNTTSVKIPYGEEQKREGAEKWHAPSELERIPSQRVFISPTVEGGSTVCVDEGATRKTSPPCRFVFTNENIETESDSLLGFDPPPPPSVSKQEATRHIFQSHTEEILHGDSIAVNAATTEAKVVPSHTSAFLSRATDPVSVNHAQSSSVDRRGNSLQPRTSGSSSRQMMDLAQLYKAAESSSMKLTPRKSVTPPRTRTRVASSPEPVPERLSMYMPSTAKTKTRRANSSSKSILHASEPHHRSLSTEGKVPTTTAAKANKTETTMAPKRNSTKVPSSGRESRRRDTLALHTSRRLAELQRALL